MSKISTEVESLLYKMFPMNTILKEHYVKFKNQKLFFDFYIKDIGVLIEVQGQQHSKFVGHFQGDKQSFLNQKYRDNLKKEYVENERCLCLVYINYDDNVTEELIRSRISKAMED